MDGGVDWDRRNVLRGKSGAKDLPQVFVDGEYIGGYSEVERLEECEQLDALLGIPKIGPEDTDDIDAPQQTVKDKAVKKDKAAVVSKPASKDAPPVRAKEPSPALKRRSLSPEPAPVVESRKSVERVPEKRPEPVQEPVVSKPADPVPEAKAEPVEEVLDSYERRRRERWIAFFFQLFFLVADQILFYLRAARKAEREAEQRKLEEQLAGKRALLFQV